jgi:hypothetical protein
MTPLSSGRYLDAAELPRRGHVFTAASGEKRSLLPIHLPHFRGGSLPAICMKNHTHLNHEDEGSDQAHGNVMARLKRYAAPRVVFSSPQESPTHWLLAVPIIGSDYEA